MTTVVFGLDGGSFELIRPWLEDGTLPELADIEQRGVAANMQSCLPPVTCPNWQCYATGKNPGKLGVFWWEGIDRETHSIRNMGQAKAFDAEYVWNSLDGRSAIINLPTSYPPSGTNGIHIAGGPGSHEDGYTDPRSLQSELEADYDYKVHPDKMSLLSSENPDSECVEEIYELIDMRFDVTENCLDEGGFELVHVTIFYLNVLQHFFWDHDVVKAAWEQIDERIGQIRQREDVEHTVVMSDHGSNEIETTFNVNTWLEQEGYLVTQSGMSDYLHRVGLTQDRLQSVLARLGLEWWARKIVPRRIQTMLPDDDGTVDKSGKARVIDWEQSTAVASSQGPVYVLATDPAKRKEITETLRAELDGLTYNGRTVLESAIPGEKLYSGPYVNQGPDLLLQQAPGVHIQGAIGKSTVFGEPDRWRGENKDTGLFLADGPSIRDDCELTDMHILDIAPTLLHLLDESVPEQLDGTVRTELFVDGTEPATREVKTVSTANEGRTQSSRDADERVTQRLDDLGYLE